MPQTVTIFLYGDMGPFILHIQYHGYWWPAAFFTKEVNWGLAKWHLANHQITSLIKEATGDAMSQHISSHAIDFVILQ